VVLDPAAQCRDFVRISLRQVRDDDVASPFVLTLLREPFDAILTFGSPAPPGDAPRGVLMVRYLVNERTERLKAEIRLENDAQPALWADNDAEQADRGVAWAVVAVEVTPPCSRDEFVARSTGERVWVVVLKSVEAAQCKLDRLESVDRAARQTLHDGP
jgi:hypothetical protein